MKSEPDVYSIDDLKKDKTTPWDSIRNYQARNFMRDDMRKGDLVLFYHSNAKPPGVAGLATVCKESYPDFTCWDPKHKYYDPKSTEEEPRWFMVDVKFKEKFDELVSLDAIKAEKSLEKMSLFQRGSRLSVQPVEKKHFEKIVKMGRSR
jgi:predicted RNA-binding protein with PUA-like domain